MCWCRCVQESKNAKRTRHCFTKQDENKAQKYVPVSPLFVSCELVGNRFLCVPVAASWHHWGVNLRWSLLAPANAPDLVPSTRLSDNEFVVLPRYWYAICCWMAQECCWLSTRAKLQKPARTEFHGNPCRLPFHCVLRVAWDPDRLDRGRHNTYLHQRCPWVYENRIFHTPCIWLLITTRSDRRDDFFKMKIRSS